MMACNRTVGNWEKTMGGAVGQGRENGGWYHREKTMHGKERGWSERKHCVKQESGG